MTLAETKDYINSLITKDSKKSQKGIYIKFVNVLEFLESRELSTEEITDLETHLDSLNLKDEVKKKHIYILKKYGNFTGYLKTKFNLTTEGYHTGIGTALGMTMGMSLGMCFGVAFNRDNGIALGMPFGMMIGLAIGAAIGSSKDKAAKEAGNVIPKTQQ